MQRVQLTLRYSGVKWVTESQSLEIILCIGPIILKPVEHFGLTFCAQELDFLKHK